jgi:CheY-like chemotaxis protein
MFRILIVEDNLSTLDLLKVYLNESFTTQDGGTDVSVHTAWTVRDGHHLIEEAAEKKKPYHAVILDFNLPEFPGEMPQINESLCLGVRQAMPSALVCHITAFADDDVVRSHLKRVHQEQIGRAMILMKLSGDFAEQLVLRLKAFLYGSEIEERMAELFQYKLPVVRKRG